MTREDSCKCIESCVSIKTKDNTTERIGTYLANGSFEILVTDPQKVDPYIQTPPRQSPAPELVPALPLFSEGSPITLCGGRSHLSQEQPG